MYQSAQKILGLYVVVPARQKCSVSVCCICLRGCVHKKMGEEEEENGNGVRIRTPFAYRLLLLLMKSYSCGVV